MAYRILALDGGGMKGLFTAVVLERLAAGHPRFQSRTQLLAGTSTGAILALGLAHGLRPSDLIALYRDHGRDIFHDTILDDIADLGGAVGARYDSVRLRRVLRREFGSATLGDLRKRVLVPTFDLDSPATTDRPRTWKPKFFHNFPGNDCDREERIVDVLARTTAAPTYFPAFQGFVDGAVVANNPSMAALAQALDRRGPRRRLQDVVLLSIGTGAEPKFIRGNRKDWGWAQWARPLVSIMVSGTTGVADFQCRQILGPRYHRVDRYLDRDVAIDDPADETLDYIAGAAEGLDLVPVLDWLRRVKW